MLINKKKINKGVILMRNHRCNAFFAEKHLAGGNDMWKSDEYYLEKAIEVSRKSRAGGNTPFGCVLVDGDGEIILEQGNVEITEKRCTGHAETVIMERASKLYDKKFLWNCTLYTTCEPCPMCAGAVYWGNVGRVVYAMTEERLLQMTGSQSTILWFSTTPLIRLEWLCVSINPGSSAISPLQCNYIYC